MVTVVAALSAVNMIRYLTSTDATGRKQPTEPQWNLGGYADNDLHRVKVTVAPS